MAKQTFTTGQVLTAAQMTSLQQTAMGGGSTTDKTASYVLVAADAGTVVQMNAAGATTITVNTALFAAGDTVQIQNVGAGVCTVTAGTATVSTSATLALKQYDAGTLYFNTTSAALFFAVDAADGMANVLTTTGDMVYSSSGTTAARLGIGSSAQVLTVSGGIPSWATPAGGGKVLQVVFAEDGTDTSFQTTTFTDTGITATITPTLNTSRIMILTSIPTDSYNAGTYPQIGLRLMRGSTAILASNIDGFMTTSSTEIKASASNNYLDSPATTSATTYKIQGACNSVNTRLRTGFDGSIGTIILMEIGA